MNKLMVAALMGAVSLMFVSALGLGPLEASAYRVAVAHPAADREATDAPQPRECDNAKNVTTSCIY